MTLRNKNELLVNHKRVYRLMKKHKLGVMRSALKACRTPQKSNTKSNRLLPMAGNRHD